MIDLSKLSAAPWTVCPASHDDADPGEMFVFFGGGTYELDRDSTMMDFNHATFIALARNAFDVLMRRRFAVIKIEEGVWCVMRDGDAMSGCWIGFTGDHSRNVQGERLEWADPFTALVEADKWYKENVKTKSGSSNA